VCAGVGTLLAGLSGLRQLTSLQLTGLAPACCCEPPTLSVLQSLQQLQQLQLKFGRIQPSMQQLELPQLANSITLLEMSSVDCFTNHQPLLKVSSHSTSHHPAASDH